MLMFSYLLMMSTCNASYCKTWRFISTFLAVNNACDSLVAIRVGLLGLGFGCSFSIWLLPSTCAFFTPFLLLPKVQHCRRRLGRPSLNRRVQDAVAKISLGWPASQFSRLRLHFPMDVNVDGDSDGDGDGYGYG